MRISDWSSDVCSSDLANSARSALYRLEQLVQESVVTVPRRLIAEAIDLVVFIQGRGTGRRIETIAEVARSEERRVGKECVSPCRSRWSPYPSQKKRKLTKTIDLHTKNFTPKQN